MYLTDNSPKSIKSISNEIEELKSLARQQNETIEELKASVKQQNETISNLNASINVFTTMFESHEIKRNGKHSGISFPQPNKFKLINSPF